MAELAGDPFGYDGAPARRSAGALTRAVGAVAALALIAAAAMWGRELASRDVGDVPFIRAQPGPMRIQPDDPGGLKLEETDLAVTRMVSGAEPGEVRLAPPPETLAAEDKPASKLTAQPDVPAAAESPAPPAEPAAEDDAPPDSAPTDPAIIALAPAASPIAPRRPAGIASRAAAAAAAAPAEAAPAPPSSLAAGDPAVQLGAFDSVAVAEGQWRAHLRRNGDLLDGLVHAVTTVRSGGRTLYRLRTGPLDDRSGAQELCVALKARGDACIPVWAE